MSSLWTPGGERPVPRPSSQPDEQHPPGDAGGEGREPTEAEMRQHMAELRDRLAATPADVVVANHAYGLFELAALHLSLEKPQLDQARLAIDAFACLVEGLGERLGEPAAELNTALAQLRLAFVQIQAGLTGAGGEGGGPAPAPGGSPGGSPGEHPPA